MASQRDYPLWKCNGGDWWQI